MPSTKPSRLVVVGVGRVGKLCAEVACLSHDLTVAGLMRRPGSGVVGIPEQLRHIPVITHIGQAKDVDGALICVPTTAAADTASEILHHGIPIVNCVTLQGEAFHTHKEAVGKVAIRHNASAIVGAGWDPGVLSVLRSWLALVTPGGTTEMTHRPGASLHHTAMARTVVGVKDALCTEVRAAGGRVQRYVYVELQRGVDPDRVAEAIRADPLFLGEDTQVFPVESLSALEQEGRGVVLDRRGASSQLGHQHFVLEARGDDAVLTAQVMLAAARALPDLEPGAYSLSDIPLSAFWGERSEKAERDWL